MSCIHWNDNWTDSFQSFNWVGILIANQARIELTSRNIGIGWLVIYYRPLNAHFQLWVKIFFKKGCVNEIIPFVRNHVKLGLCSFVKNFNSVGGSIRALFCVVDTGYRLGRSLGDCRLALLEVQKFQQWLKHIWATLGAQYYMADFGFLILWGLMETTGMCHAGVWGFSRSAQRCILSVTFRVEFSLPK